MSVWADLHSRGIGETSSEEEWSQIYHKRDTERTILVEKEYKDFKYKIVSDGKYPVLSIQAPNNISCFSGYGEIYLKIEKDKEDYCIERYVNFGVTKFIYSFNKEGDYVYGKQDGHMYSVQEMETYAEKIIDKIIQCESEFVNDMDKS